VSITTGISLVRGIIGCQASWQEEKLVQGAWPTGLKVVEKQSTKVQSSEVPKWRLPCRRTKKSACDSGSGVALLQEIGQQL
jgi:hypothetical protein